MRIKVAHPLLAVRGLQIAIAPLGFVQDTKPHSQEWLSYKKHLSKVQ